MKKIANAILVMIFFSCFVLKVDASDSRDVKGELNTNDIETVQITDGHERIYMEGVVIDDITTENYRKIVTQSGDDISEFYEDYSMGIAVMTLNGHVVEIYDMDEVRRQSVRTWHRFDSDKIVWGIAIVFGTALVGGGVWSCVPRKK